MFEHRVWKEIKIIPIFEKLYEFYEGIFYSYDEANFDHGSDMIYTFMKITYAEFDLDPNIIEIWHLGNSPYRLKNSIFIEYRGSRIEKIYLDVQKEVTDYEKNIGTIRIISAISNPEEIQNINYETGKKIGKNLTDTVSVFNNGLEKEIFDSITLFFLSRENSQYTRSIEYEIHDHRFYDQNILSLEVRGRKASFRYDLVREGEVPYIQYYGLGFDSRTEITPKLLERIRGGELKLVKAKKPKIE